MFLMYDVILRQHIYISISGIKLISLSINAFIVYSTLSFHFQIN